MLGWILATILSLGFSYTSIPICSLADRPLHPKFYGFFINAYFNGPLPLCLCEVPYTFKKLCLKNIITVINDSVETDGSRPWRSGPRGTAWLEGTWEWLYTPGPEGEQGLLPFYAWRGLWALQVKSDGNRVNRISGQTSSESGGRYFLILIQLSPSIWSLEYSKTFSFIFQPHFWGFITGLARLIHIMAGVNFVAGTMSWMLLFCARDILDPAFISRGSSCLPLPQTPQLTSIPPFHPTSAHNLYLPSLPCLPCTL